MHRKYLTILRNKTIFNNKHMRQIGFKNFRKFEDLPLLDLNPITILVGENNAGKSTVVKAILSVLDFLNSTYFDIDRTDKDKSILNQYFYFNKSYFAHIGTFKRALYNKAENSTIHFTLTLDNLKFGIDIAGDIDDDEAICGKIDRISMNIIKWNIDITFDFKNDDICAIFNKTPSELFIYQKDIVHLHGKSSKTVKKEIDKYFASIPDDAEIHTKITGNSGMIGGPLIDCLLYRLTDKIVSTIEPETREREKEANSLFSSGLTVNMKKFFKANNRILSRFGLLGLPFSFSYDLNVEYIYAHAVTQTVIYSAKDTNDYFVKTIHEFANLRIQRSSDAYKFIIKWMKEFNIGVEYEIKSVGGEAHIVKIYAEDKSCVNLADKGMGSIQLMILLFRLATKIAERMSHGRFRRENTTVIVEEPEQNLHPMLQSKLADLFFELISEYDFKFLIETHSEYLIRKTQLIVNTKFNSEEKLSKNPFKVYYFPSEGDPYAMEYRPDGKFSNKFGSGFFGV